MTDSNYNFNLQWNDLGNNNNCIILAHQYDAHFETTVFAILYFSEPGKKVMEILQIESTSQPKTCQLGREREWFVERLSFSNALRVDKDRKNLPSSLSLSSSFQTNDATYRAAYGLSTLSVISLWKNFGRCFNRRLITFGYKTSLIMCFPLHFPERYITFSYFNIESYCVYTAVTSRELSDILGCFWNVFSLFKKYIFQTLITNFRDIEKFI